MSKTFSRATVVGLCLVGVAGAITLRATPPTPPTPPAPPASPLQAPPPDTAALYKLHCQVCHGANGKAALPEMAFVERDWKHGTSSAEMAKVITEGVTGTPMMPFKGKLTPEQITALAKHVRAFDTRLKPEKQ